MIRLYFLAVRSASEVNIIGERTIKDEVHAAAGLNWGYSTGLPGLEDGYIPIQSNMVEEEEIGEKDGIPHRAIFDDGDEFMIRLEGNGVSRGDIQYPKQIASNANKEILGRYLRRRIGDEIGRNLTFSQYAINEVGRIKKRHSQNPEAIRAEIDNDVALKAELEEKFITLDDLRAYGREHIDIEIRLDENGERVYYLDFSI